MKKEDYSEVDKQISEEVTLEMRMHPYLHKYFYESGYELNHVQMRWVCLAMRDFATEKCKEQREACTNQIIIDEDTRVLIKDLKWLVENTPIITDIK